MELIKNLVQVKNNWKPLKQWEFEQQKNEKIDDALRKKYIPTKESIEKAKNYSNTIIDSINIMDKHTIDKSQDANLVVANYSAIISIASMLLGIASGRFIKKTNLAKKLPDWKPYWELLGIITLTSVSNVFLNIWQANVAKKSARIARFQTRENELKDFNNFIVYTKDQKDEAKEISGIENILYLSSFESLLFSLFNSSRKSFEAVESIYLDLERRNNNDYSTKALRFSKDFKEKYPEINIKNAYLNIVSLRMIKSEEEIAKIQESIDVTKGALENVMKNIKPGLYEYQVETYYDSYIKFHGQKEKSFETICATGKNATILHYVNNNSIIQDNDLVLFDLGCCTDYYISDISRTYPANGKFTERQKQIYEIVLNCNKKCIEFLKPGLTWDEYNKYANSLLIEGLKNIGLIKEDKELIKYYWHSIGHSIGLDTHDPDVRVKKFEEGMLMTVEPGLYLEDEGIGIRIEDNILITKDGCVNLSKDIIKEIDDIEKFMRK